MTEDIPDIRLPPELRPADGRFGSGPSKVRPEATAALAAAAPTFMGTSHRAPPVRAGLAELFALPDGYEVLRGNGGASVFWDAAIFGLIERRSLHFSFGEFSSRFASLVGAAPHLEEPVVIESAVGTHPEMTAGPGDIDLYGLTHNETSTGVTMAVARPQGAAPTALVAVDATSAAGAMSVDPNAFDCYYFSPQKAFGSDGGLWVALCSPAAVERIERLTASGRWSPTSLSLSTALANSRLDQTLNTPSLATLFLLAAQVDWIAGLGGLEWSARRCQMSSDMLYGWADSSAYATPFVADPAKRSTVTGTIDLDESVDGAMVAAVLRANGVVDTDPYRRLGRNQLRIAMFPAIEPADVATLTQAIDYVVGELAG